MTFGVDTLEYTGKNTPAGWYFRGDRGDVCKKVTFLRYYFQSKYLGIFSIEQVEITVKKRELHVLIERKSHTLHHAFEC